MIGVNPADLPVPMAGSKATADQLREALRLFTGAAYAVSRSIKTRGYAWSEAYLDQALAHAVGLDDQPVGVVHRQSRENGDEALTITVDELAEVDAILAEFAGGSRRVRVAVKLGTLRKLRADLDPTQTLDGLKKLWRTGVETGRILATAEAADAAKRLSPEETARANRVLDDMAPPLLAAKWGEFERAAIVRAMLMYGDIVAADRTDMAAADVAEVAR
jgi:hypothetical protein